MNNFHKQWMEDICLELNNAGLEMPQDDGGGKWSVDRFENSIHLIKKYVTLDRGIYDYLNSKGLTNRGYCPITGEKIGTSNLYQIFGRKVYISEEGEKIAKEWDRKEHIRVWGKEPMTEAQTQEAYEHFRHEKQSAKTMTILFLLIVFLGIIYILKKC